MSCYEIGILVLTFCYFIILCIKWQNMGYGMKDETYEDFLDRQ